MKEEKTQLRGMNIKSDVPGEGLLLRLQDTHERGFFNLEANVPGGPMTSVRLDVESAKKMHEWLRKWLALEDKAP